MLRFLLGFCLILMGKIYLQEYIYRVFPKPFIKETFEKIQQYMKYVLSFSVFIAVVAFFSPTPTQGEGLKLPQVHRFFGDLVPSVMLFFMAIGESKVLRELFHIPESWDGKFEHWTQQYRQIFGLLSIVLGIIHWFIGRSMLL